MAHHPAVNLVNRIPLIHTLGLLILFQSCGFAAVGPLEVLSNPSPFVVLGGSPRPLPLSIRNQGTSAVEAQLTARLYQTTSSTAVPLADAAWKKLQLLPGQTVFESATVAFPSVRAETPFLIKWLDDAHRVLGQTLVLVYPTNLLEGLKPLLADEPLGLFDPTGVLKPLFNTVTIEFQDLANHNFTNFTGRLAIVGPFVSRAQVREGLGQQVRKLAERGTGILWIQPPPQHRDKLRPSFYTVLAGKGAVVVAQANLVSSPADNPIAQSNLVYLAQLAVCPQENQLPFEATQ